MITIMIAITTIINDHVTITVTITINDRKCTAMSIQK